MNGYDAWKLRSDMDDNPQHGEPPVDGPDELELVYEQLFALQDAVLSCASHVEEDADFDGERYVNQSTYHLTFSRRGFLAIMDAFGIEAETGQSDLDAFKAAAMRTRK